MTIVCGEEARKVLEAAKGKAPPPPDLPHPSMRSWLETLPKGSGRAAGFETGIWWSPGSAAKTILDKLGAAGYQPAAKAQRFVVQGKYGPLREGVYTKEDLLALFQELHRQTLLQRRGRLPFALRTRTSRHKAT